MANSILQGNMPFDRSIYSKTEVDRIVEEHSHYIVSPAGNTYIRPMDDGTGTIERTIEVNKYLSITFGVDPVTGNATIDGFVPAHGDVPKEVVWSWTAPDAPDGGNYILDMAGPFTDKDGGQVYVPSTSPVHDGFDPYAFYANLWGRLVQAGDIPTIVIPSGSIYVLKETDGMLLPPGARCPEEAVYNGTFGRDEIVFEKELFLDFSSVEEVQEDPDDNFYTRTIPIGDVSSTGLQYRNANDYDCATHRYSTEGEFDRAYSILRSISLAYSKTPAGAVRNLFVRFNLEARQDEVLHYGLIPEVYKDTTNSYIATGDNELLPQQSWTPEAPEDLLFLRNRSLFAIRYKNFPQWFTFDERGGFEGHNAEMAEGSCQGAYHEDTPSEVVSDSRVIATLDDLTDIGAIRYAAEYPLHMSDPVDNVVTMIHDVSGVASGNYGEHDARSVAPGGSFVVTKNGVNATGHVTEESNVSITLDVSAGNVMMGYDSNDRTVSEVIGEIQEEIGGGGGGSITERLDAVEGRLDSNDLRLDGIDDRLDSNDLEIEELEERLDDLYLEIAYSDLVAKRNNGELVPGASYRITDYEATVANDASARAISHPFDIIVTADSENKLNEVARAIMHSADNYFSVAGCKLEAWKVWYCLGNDTARFSWASTNGKGVVYRLIDEFNNDCPYDFKGVQFKAYNDTNNVWRYTFDSGSSSANTDYSLTGGSNAVQVYGNTIKPYRSNGKVKLNRIVFKGNKCHSNIIGNDGYDNTFGSSCYYNVFGTDCHSIVFGTGCFSNRFGNICHNDVLGDRCRYNVFGNYSITNTVQTDGYYNTFGNNCASNTLGDGSQSNTFASGCSYNSFGGYCFYNILGGGCSYNSFGDNCRSNTFGDSCSNNDLRSYCSSNTFGDNCSYNGFGTYCCVNSFGSNCGYNAFGDTLVRSFSISSQYSPGMLIKYQGKYYNFRADYKGTFNQNTRYFRGEYLYYYSQNGGAYYVCIAAQHTGLWNENDFSRLPAMENMLRAADASDLFLSYYRYITFEEGNCNVRLACPNTSSSSYYQNVTIANGLSDKLIPDSNSNQSAKTVYQPAGSQIISL